MRDSPGLLGGRLVLIDTGCEDEIDIFKFNAWIDEILDACVCDKNLGVVPLHRGSNSLAEDVFVCCPHQRDFDIW